MATELTTLDPALLDGVTGGRKTQVEQIDPALVQGIGKLAEAVSAVGQTLAASKQQQSSQTMQMFQAMMQKGGGPR